MNFLPESTIGEKESFLIVFRMKLFKNDSNNVLVKQFRITPEMTINQSIKKIL